jgi:hypothetical protein
VKPPIVFGKRCSNCRKPGYLVDVELYAYENDPGPANVVPQPYARDGLEIQVLQWLRVQVRKVFFCDRTKGCEEAGPWTVTETAISSPPVFSVFERTQ